MGIETENINRYRYPGTKFFEADQNDIFFGRKEETINLIHSIKAHDVFVIFADSGIGKTSLLNAGLIPELEKGNEQEKFLPVKFRFQDISSSPVQIIAKKFSEYTDAAGALPANEEPLLWRLFKSCVFKDGMDAKERLPLLVFDQFEEFFNHKKPDRESCIDQLSDLLNQYLPEYVREEMAVKFKDRAPTAEEIKYYAPPRLKMLFLIRADKLKLLDDFTKKIPLILRNRFHLKPLNIIQAEQAILFPACLPRNGFFSPAFSYQEAAITQINNYLKNDEGEVESFQLQILCQELEKRVIDRYNAAPTADAVQITEAELGGEAGMNDITKNYYLNKINSIADAEMRRKAIELIEDNLIIDDRRISQAEALLLKEGYSQELLDFLLNKTRLIRIDNDRYVEISHDRLLPSILELKQKRKEAEMRADSLKQVREEEERRSQQLLKQNEENIKKLELVYLKDKVKKAARLKIYVVLLIVLLIFVLGSLITAIDSKIKADMSKADSYIEKQEYDRADSIINEKGIFNLFNFNQDSLRKMRIKIKPLIVIKKSFNSFLKQADSLTKAGTTLVATADSIINSIAVLIDQNAGTSVYEQEINKQKIIDLIGGEGLMLARNLYDSAYHTADSAYDKGFEILPKTGQAIKANIKLIEETVPHLFKQSIDVAYLFWQVKQKEKIVTTLTKAQVIASFAAAFGISLSDQDIHDFQKLTNEKKMLSTHR